VVTTVVDSHLHLWDNAVIERPWLSPLSLSPLAAPEDYASVAPQGSRSVLVESGVPTSRRLDEAGIMTELAASFPAIAAVIVAAPSDPAAVGGYLDTVRTATSLLRGIRMSSSSRFRETRTVGEQLVTRGLVLEILASWDDPGLEEMLEVTPSQLTVVLDHALAPPIAEGWGSQDARRWLEIVRRAAVHPGVVVKLSGLATRTAVGEPWRKAAEPFVLATLETFGSERCMYGSDWPMTTVREDADPVQYLDFLLGLAEDSDAQDNVAAAVATRVYSL
jgi:L-fuconolactonase